MISQSPFDATAFAASMQRGGPEAEVAARGLIRHCRPLLRARFFRAGVALQDMDDLLSEVLTSVVKSIQQLREPSRFDAWVYGIATNVLNQHWGQVGRSRELFKQVADTPLPREGDVEQADALADWLPEYADLSHGDAGTAICMQAQLEKFRQEHPQRYACVELLALGYEAREIAAHLGRSYGATRQFISQCCAVVMNFLKPCVEASELLGRKRGQAEAD